MMLTKGKLSSRILRTKCPEKLISLMSELEETESEISASLYKHRTRLEREKVTQIKSNPKVFYNYARKFSKTAGSIGPLLDKDDNPVAATSEMAAILSRQYSAMWSKPTFSFDSTSAEVVLNLEPPQEDCLTNIEVSQDNVRTALSSLSAGAAPGPDGIPAAIIKGGGELIIIALTDIFSLSLKTGEIPEGWKNAFISPIWKGGNKTDPANYRPIALTAHLVKLLERVIHPIIYKHLTEGAMLDDTQHGARPGRSTISQLLEQHRVILSMLEANENVSIVYLDFAKAYDKVDLGILLQKINAFKIRGVLGTWITNFLVGRLQSVRINDHLSNWEVILSGVPQGSVLGSLMFLIYIADLGSDVSSNTKILKYVDDSKAIAKAKTEEDIENLQEDLNKLYSWQERNNMEFNGPKFQAVRMGKRNLTDSTLLFTPNYDDPIKEVDSAKDLGILIDSDGDFVSQRREAARKTTAKAGWILRSFHSRDKALLRSLWMSLCQPHSDYGSQLWSTAMAPSAIELQEAPLRTFTRKMTGLKKMSYWDRLSAANLSSIERRAERYRIIYAWKIAANLVPNPGMHFEISTGRNGGMKFTIPDFTGKDGKIRTLINRSFFSEGPRLFNMLPAWMRDTKVSLTVFKSRLDGLMSLLPDHPRTQDHSPEPTADNGLRSNSVRDWLRHLDLLNWAPVNKFVYTTNDPPAIMADDSFH
jgi:hypothetical protein